MEQKPFDNWNESKKRTHSRSEIIEAHQREIWWTVFGVNVGIEIDGKHETFERPGIVFRRFNVDMAWIIPVTSQRKDMRFHVPFTFEEKGYWAAITQIRTISTKRLLRKIGMVPLPAFHEMQQRIAELARTDERSPAQGGTSRRPKP